MNELTKEQIAELKRAEAKATPGPWWIIPCPQHPGQLLLKYRYEDVPTWICEFSDRAEAGSDASFMIAMRHHAPALIAAAATFFSIFAGIFLLLSQLEKYCGINTGSET